MQVEIRSLKLKGTSVRLVRGNYYVYTYSHMKDLETWKWNTVTGKLIGRIIARLDFYTNDDGAKSETVTSFDYGEYLLAGLNAMDDYSLIKELINPD